MSLLLEHLHTLPASSTPESIEAHFREKFGVVVRNEGDLYLFKYHQMDANWTEPLTSECRGTIARRSLGAWELVSRPFDKFFNLNQGRCPVFEQKELEARLPECSLVEKADGTCIQLWWDTCQGGWRASTLGTITTGDVPEQDYTFSDLFWMVSGISSAALLKKGTTYIFELCCDENRIVTKYDVNQVVLLGARGTHCGLYVDPSNLSSQVRWWMAEVRLARHVPVASLNIHTRDDLITYVESESERDQDGVEYPEGYVLYDPDGVPLAKLKNQRYLALHHTSGGDIGCSKNKIVDAIFLGFIDDVYEPLTDRLKAFADVVQIWARELRSRTHVASDALGAGGPYENRKAIAMAIKKIDLPGPVRGFFFRNIQSYLDGSMQDFDDRFGAWLKGNYSKFDWKGTER